MQTKCPSFLSHPERYGIEMLLSKAFSFSLWSHLNIIDMHGIRANNVKKMVLGRQPKHCDVPFTFYYFPYYFYFC